MQLSSFVRVKHPHNCQILLRLCHCIILLKLKSNPYEWLTLSRLEMFSKFIFRSKWKFAWFHMSDRKLLCIACRIFEGLFRTFWVDFGLLGGIFRWMHWIRRKLPHKHENILLKVNLNVGINVGQKRHNCFFDGFNHERNKLRVLPNLSNYIP